MNSNERFNQLEELMANLTRNVDRLSSDMEEFKKYAFENTKVVNSILHKLDDHSEQFEKILERMESRDEQFRSEQKLRDAQFEFIMKRFDKLDS